MVHPRHLISLSGSAEGTRNAARVQLGTLDPAAVLWVDTEPAPAPFQSTAHGDVKRCLGQSFDAVVLVVKSIDPDVLGQCHGLIRAGGYLVLRWLDAMSDPRLAVHPYGLEHVTQRLRRRVAERAQAASESLVSWPAPVHVPAGSGEQEQVVSRLRDMLSIEVPTHSVVLADRGRGKSSALGLALRGLDGRIAVTAPNKRSAAEVFRFAPDAEFVSPNDLVYREGEYDIIAVDEAAQLPVPVLQRLVAKYPDARMVFATTARGYEGTGRGFVLRFLAWLEVQGRPVERLTLHAPIRWEADDPLERFVLDALLLDARPSDVLDFDLESVRHVVLDRDKLASNEALLRGFFGLLVHAHYRTTPSDLHRILDAPNLRLHALLCGGAVVAATMVAEEGGLPGALVEALYSGRERARGHALPETLICHSGHKEAGEMRILRSVRIAVHPELRRLGLGSQLINAVHASDTPDFFGTLFGATPSLLKFRRQAGYELVRVGISAGTRTGEPSAAMMRPVSARAEVLFKRLRAELSRDLPLQLEMMQAGEALFIDPELSPALLANLPEPAGLTPEIQTEAVQAYVSGPRPWEASAYPVRSWVIEQSLDGLDATDAALIKARIVEKRGWTEVAQKTGMPSVRAAIRALRSAMQALVARH